MDKRSEILARINDYLCMGGLFNPECMDHNKVRELLLDSRDYITHQEEVRVAQAHKDCVRCLELDQ
jgi:hypothetical protein